MLIELMSTAGHIFTKRTFSHSYASLLLEANYDIRSIQELLGHFDVCITMITHMPCQSKTRK